MEVNVNTALKFIDDVQGVYGVSSQEYNDFINVMKDFKTGSVSSQDTHKRIIVLFRGHPELIEEYAIFIPPGHTIDIPADPQGNILLRMPTGTAEITRDGAVVNETHIEVPEPQGEEVKSPALPEQEKRLLDTLRARIVGTEEQEEYEALIKSFEANLIISPEQRKASLDAGQGREFVEKLQGLLGDHDELKKALSEVLG